MSLKKFLAIPLLLSLGAFVYYSAAVRRSLTTLGDVLHPDSKLGIVIVLAALLQICGHLIRAYKAELLFSPVKPSTTRFQFRGLSIGYLFNTLLPFRLGELVRARIIAGGLGISFTFAFTLIIFERSLDALILGMIGIVATLCFPSISSAVLSYSIGIIVLAIAILAVVTLLIRQDTFLFRRFYKTTGLFRDGVKNSLRFKIWSVIYGLQRTLTMSQMVRYIVLTVLAWLFYIASVSALVRYLFSRLDTGHTLLASIAPYFGVGIPAGPANLGVFSHVTQLLTSPLQFSQNDNLIFNLLAWSILVVPISLAGGILLLTKTREALWNTPPKQASATSLENKLRRNEDISQEMSSFLENYFAGNTLSKIVHGLELQDDFRLMRYFKGGSDAITILASQNGQQVVKKIIPPEFEDRLKAQYVWLAQRQSSYSIVKVLNEKHTDRFYSIDLEYRPDDIMFNEFMHQNPIPESKKILDEVWQCLKKEVHGKPGKLKANVKARDAYVQKHIFDCLEKAAGVRPEILRATKSARLTINGKQYDNLFQIMEKIKRHPQAWNDIATYKATPVVHGDVAVDNILVGKDRRPLLIDPAPDGNLINGPVFDFGKNMQSLYCGYEFLLHDEAPVFLTGNDDTIAYRDQTSSQFNQLCDYVRTELAPRYLSQPELRSIIFHAAALHIRRLKHQVYYNPDNTLKFYAVGVKTLNEFLAQYES